MRNALKAKIRELIQAKENTFVNIDLGVFTGLIIIQDEDNRLFKQYVSKIVEIDDLLGDELEADITQLNMRVEFPYIDDKNVLRIEISFVYDN